jgi:DNA modification methylase
MSYQVLNMDVRAGLATLPDNHFHCAITSPPYWGLRDYGVSGQLGLESTPDEYIANMVEVCRGIKRVLRDDGVFFLNVGDSYAAGGLGAGSGKQRTNAGSCNGSHIEKARKAPDGLKPKDLCLIPWRLLLALQADGWYVRSVIVWSKRSPMPESVTDRPTSAWEPIFLLSKSERYFYDAVAVAEPSSVYPEQRTPRGRVESEYAPGDRSDGWKNDKAVGFGVTATRNLRNVWTLDDNAALLQWLCGNHRDVLLEWMKSRGTGMADVWTLSSEPCPEAHFATFPSEIPHRAIAAGTSERGCCPECGAPWRRVVETTLDREEAERIRSRRTLKHCDQQKDADQRKLNGNDLAKIHRRTTTGWQPTCACNAGEPVPCRVLEPFAGAGTTLREAVRMGRDSVGIELNPAYVEIIHKRIGNDCPLLALEAV